MNTVVHLCVPEKFIPPLIKLIEQEMGLDGHFFLFAGRSNRYSVHVEGHTRELRSLGARLLNLRRLYSADKIILHGLYDSKFLYLLALQPWLLKKCCWWIWGHDLYQYLDSRSRWKQRFKESVRRFVIRRLGQVSTYIPGEFELARKWYGAQAEFKECLMYDSNVFTPAQDQGPRDSTIVILLGNSAFQRNNHLQALDMLSAYSQADIKVYAPLSYGPQDYALQVAEYGKKLLGNKFVPMFDFMEKDAYLAFLNRVDIAMFNNVHQQAMGNIISLLGRGKTVYLRETTTSWNLFQQMGVFVMSFDDFSLNLLSSEQRQSNVGRIETEFSREKLVAQLKNLMA